MGKKMINILIVDDEPEIVEFIYSLLLDMNIPDLFIYKALSGEEAIGIFNRYRMDIVISDIKMPGISGIQLLHRIKKYWKECKFIILTGHKEFDDIYQATRYGDVSFLLKTCETQEIIEHVERLIDELRKENKTNTDSQEISSVRIDEAKFLLKNELLSLIILGAANTEKFSENYLQSINIGLNMKSETFLVLGKMDENDTPLFIDESAKYFKLNAIVERHLPDFMHHDFLIIENIYMAWCIQFNIDDSSEDFPSNPEMLIYSIFDKVQTDNAEFGNSNVSFACNNKPSLLKDISEAYFELRNCINRRIGFGQLMLVSQDNSRQDPAFNDRDEAIEPKLYNKLINSSKIGTSLELGLKESYKEAIEPYFRSIPSSTTMKSTVAMELYLHVSLQLIGYINRFGIQSKISEKIDINPLLHPELFTVWSDALHCLDTIADALFSIQGNEQSNRSNSYVKTLKQHIDDNLDKDLSLVRLADLVKIHPSYLSRLFKQATGDTVSDYILKAKIEFAKSMLAKTDEKISTISFNIGFFTPSYFTRFFKKIVGTSPQDYRRLAK